MRFWFADWTLGGTKVDAHDERAYGPILFALYTVSRGVLKLSAQCPPLGNAPKEVRLQIRNGGNRWKTIATAELDPDAWNAVFRVPAWNDSKDHAYRLLYAMPDAGGKLRQHSFEGTIRKDPKGRNEITVGLLTCMWDMGFPHAEFTRHLGWHKPDVLLWTGDQVYEAGGRLRSDGNARSGTAGSLHARLPAQVVHLWLGHARPDAPDSIGLHAGRSRHVPRQYLGMRRQADRSEPAAPGYKLRRIRADTRCRRAG